MIHFIHVQNLLDYSDYAKQYVKEHREYSERYKDRYPNWTTIFFGTSSISFAAFRVAIKEGRLASEQFKATFQDSVGEQWPIVVDRHGKCNHWPKGFFGTYFELVRRLI